MRSAQNCARTCPGLNLKPYEPGLTSAPHIRDRRAKAALLRSFPGLFETGLILAQTKGPGQVYATRPGPQAASPQADTFAPLTCFRLLGPVEDDDAAFRLGVHGAAGLEVVDEHVHVQGAGFQFLRVLEHGEAVAAAVATENTGGAFQDFMVAREALADALNGKTTFRKKGYVDLLGKVETPTETTADHDGCAVVLVARE